MFLSFLIARLSSARAFVWQPALTMNDSRIICALIPGGQN